MASFRVFRDGGIVEYTNHHDIEPGYEHIVGAEFDLLEPADGDDHSDYQHAVFDSYNNILGDLMVGERTRKFWPGEIDKLTNLTLYSTDEQMSTAIIDVIDTVDLNRGAYIQGGYYAGSV